MIIYNAISWLFSAREVPATDMGTLSCLPADVLVEMMSYLPIHDVMSLHQTGKKVYSIIETTLYSKTQIALESFAKELLEDEHVNANLKKMGVHELHNLKKGESVPNNTKEKCQALRENICSFFKSNDLNSLFSVMSAHHSDDPFLFPYMISNLSNKFISFVEYDGVNSKACILFFNMISKELLETGQLDLIVLHKDLDDRCLRAFTKAISSSLFLHDLHLRLTSCNLEHMDLILSSARKNDSINKITLIEIDTFWNDDDIEAGNKHFDKLYQICATHLQGNHFEDKGNSKDWVWKK